VKIPGALALVLISLPASAQWQTVFLSTQVCFESSRFSVSLTQADRAAAREKRQREEGRAPVMAECETNDDCEGYCIRGRCVEAVDEHVESAKPVETEPPLQPPSVARCSTDAQCAEGQSCMNGFCMSPPPPPSSLSRTASELFVRHSLPQLRQDLALGEGPVINTLALSHGVSSKELGKLMRAHRGELARMLGDVDDVKWPKRFLARIDLLVARSTAQGLAQR
jgi:hypothetical protein